MRHRAATLALGATIGLTLLKLSAAWASHSVGVLSEGVHSFLDLISAAISYFTVKEAGKPADADHPFGHGKIETLSSLFESILLIVAGLLIFYEGIHHLAYPEPLEHQGFAIISILISIGVSYFVYRQNRNVALLTESSALHVNSLHFLSDVVASIAVLAGLILVKLTGWVIIDSFLGFGVALYILGISLKQVKSAFLELTDTQLPEDELQILRRLFDDFRAESLEVHDLRTRKSGSTRHIDFHLVMCAYHTVEGSHSVCDEMEVRILQFFPRASINIHVEPCEREKVQCHLSCPIYATRKRPHS